MINYLRLSLVVLLLFYLNSCEKSTDPKDSGYVFDSTTIVTIDSFFVKDSISFDDTLHIKLWSVLLGDNCRLSYFDVKRDSHNVDVSVFVDVYHWEGDFAMPPCACPCLEGDTCFVLPPFYSGNLFLTINQPDSSILEDTIYVE